MGEAGQSPALSRNCSKGSPRAVCWSQETHLCQRTYNPSRKGVAHYGFSSTHGPFPTNVGGKGFLM